MYEKLKIKQFELVTPESLTEIIEWTDRYGAAILHFEKTNVETRKYIIDSVSAQNKQVVQVSIDAYIVGDADVKIEQSEIHGT